MSQGYASAGLPDPDAVWADYTPTFTNFTLGNGTIDIARFIEIENSVFVKIQITLGSTSSVSGAIEVSLPVTGVAFAKNTFGAHLTESGVDNFSGVVQIVSSTAMRLVALDSSTAFLTFTATSSTVPFTWGTSDAFAMTVWYEAA